MALERRTTDYRGGLRYYSDAGFGELFTIRSGVTYSTRAIHIYFAKRDCCSEYNFLQHLSQDVNQVRNLMNQCQTTMLVGDLGAGKSTTIFGVRRELREEGQEYVHVNGHFVDKQNHIVHAIDTARRRKMSVIYDSFDYLFRRKSTSFRKETAVARKIILGKIRDLVDSGSGLLLSSHTEPWLRFHLSTDSLDEYNAVRDELGATSHRIVGYLGDESERRALAYDITESDEFTGQYMQYSNQSELRTSRTYRVMKLMARSNLALLGQQQFNEAVMAIDKQSRAKMRAPEDYDLCPLPDGI